MTDTTLRTQLREALDAHLSLNQIKDLVFDLRIDPEAWPDKGKPGLIRELLLALERTGRSVELLALLGRKYPTIAWPGINQDPSDASPYRGLQAFDVGDAALFFGREALTRKHIERLHTTRFLAVVGASGSGKSSLVRAGVVATLLGKKPAPPDLKLLDGISERHTFILTPTDRPLRELATKLTRHEESVRAASTLMADLLADPHSLDLYAGRMLGDDAKAHMLIVVDQFEELFTACKDEAEQRAFIENLRYASDDAHGGRVTVILTLRADFYARCAPFDAFYKALPAHQENVTAMQPDELRQAIEEPARASGLMLEPGLAETLLADAGAEPGALPLLSHALLETWRRRERNTPPAARGKLTLGGYAESGGLRGAIAQTAEREFDALTPDDQAIARRIFVALTELNIGAPDTRRRAKLAGLLSAAPTAPQLDAVLNRFVQARLVTGDAETTYEVAHEAVIRNWSRLAGWLQDGRTDLILERQIQQAAEDWRDRGRDRSDLYRGLRLNEAVAWQATHAADPTASAGLAVEFLAASLAEEQRQVRELQALEGRAKNARRLTAVSLAMAAMVVLIGLLAVASLTRTAATVNSDIATARAEGTTVALDFMNGQAQFRADQSLNELRNGNTLNALFLALESLKNYPTVFDSQSGPALSAALDSPRRETAFTHASYVYGAAWSKDETKVLTWSDDNTARVSEAATGKTLVEVKHDSSVSGAAWSKDETKVLTWSFDNTARVSEAATGKTLVEVKHAGRVSGAAWSKDETKVLTWSDDNTARVSEAATGKTLVEVKHDSSVSGAAWSKDETKVLTWSFDNTARVSEAATGKTLVEVKHAGRVYGAAWSKDETKVLTWSDDNTARVSEAATGKTLVEVKHAGRVYGAAWSKDETKVLTWSDDNTARVSEAATGKTLVEVKHAGRVYGAAWSKDETKVLTWSFDNTARVSEAATGKTLVEVKHASYVYGAAWSKDETKVLTWSGDNTARVSEAATGKTLVEVKHAGWVYGAAWSKDETKVLTWSDDGTVRVSYATLEKSIALARDWFARASAIPEPERIRLRLPAVPTATATP